MFGNFTVKLSLTALILWAATWVLWHHFHPALHVRPLLLLSCPWLVFGLVTLASTPGGYRLNKDGLDVAFQVAWRLSLVETDQGNPQVSFAQAVWSRVGIASSRYPWRLFFRLHRFQ